MPKIKAGTYGMKDLGKSRRKYGKKRRKKAVMRKVRQSKSPSKEFGEMGY